MMRKANTFLAAALVLLATLGAGATTMVRMNLDELTAAAQVVARVRCVESEVRAEGGEIWTFTRFEVVETIKGAAPREVTVRLMGGRLGHLISRVEGVPRFQPGEELFLFLEPTRAGELSVTSWVQGTFRIRRDPATRRETVTQDTSSVTMFDPQTRTFRSGGARNLPIEQFRQHVRQAAERAGRQP